MTEQGKKSSAYLQVVLMFAILIATILLGLYMMPSSQEEHDRLLAELGTTNHGKLLLPVKPVADLTLTDSDGDPWDWDEHKPKWRILIPSDASCSGDCQDLLYTTRQVHIRLGKYTSRLERILVVTAPALDGALAEKLVVEHPYLKIVHTGAGAVTDWLADTNSPAVPGRSAAVLVDPAGAAMMTYTTDHAGNEILEDLNHLLKYSGN